MIDHQTVVIFTKESLDANKPISVVNIPPLKFSGVPTRQVIKGNIQGARDTDRSVAVVTEVGTPVEEAFLGITMNSRRAVIL